MSINSSTIKFYLGEESRLVIEDSKTKNESIFKDAYGVALNVISEYIGNRKKTPKNNTSVDFFRQTADAVDNNIIAFIGDRGAGKSSCMLSVANMLGATGGNINDSDMPESIKSCENGFEILETIDPSFFEEKTNILEIVLGRMFSNFKKMCKIGNVANCGNYEEEKNALFKAFQEVKESLVQKNGCQIDEEDYVDSLLKLTASVDLRDSFKKLIDCYLRFTKKDYFVIAVDDLDLNAEYAYKMTEQIRKYLRQEKVLVLMALKLEQLEHGIQLAFERQYQDLEDKRGLFFQDMVAKYVGKLIPEKNRVVLPTVDVWVDSTIRILKKSDKDGSWIDYDERHNNQTLKYYVVSLIFQKTRYLFYHAEGKISPIVPSNLRELRQLIGTLCAMPDYKDDMKCEHNKEIFKEYFLKVWIPNKLSYDYAIFVQKLFKISNPSDINKIVIQKLKENAIDKLPTDWNMKDSTATELEIVQAVDDANATYNVSLGDVFMTLSYLKGRTKDDNNQMLFFAIETFYSMRLYEYYDLMTENEVVKRKEELSKKIDYTIKRNSKLDGLSAYDMLVGGSFVNMEDTCVLSPRKNGQRRDVRWINIKPINELLESIKNEGDPGDDKLKWVEFFILFISRKNYDTKKSGVSETRWRKQEEIYYIAPLNSQRLKFDVFSIFVNVVNIERHYKRFSDELYIRATDPKADSLYNRLKKYCYDNRKRRSNPPDTEWDERWNLLSWGAIRNIDVLENLIENTYTLNKGYGGANFEHISAFLRNISEFKMKTYDVTTNNDRRSITFEFFKCIREFIEVERKKGNEGTFDAIYSSFCKDSDSHHDFLEDDEQDSAQNTFQKDLSDGEANKMLKKKSVDGICRFIQNINPALKRNPSFNNFWLIEKDTVSIPLSISDAKKIYRSIMEDYIETLNANE